jgi:hypothetical protein
VNTHPVLNAMLVEARRRDLAAACPRDRHAARNGVAAWPPATEKRTPRARAWRLLRASLAAFGLGPATAAANPA